MGNGMFPFDGPRLTREIAVRGMTHTDFAAAAGVATNTVRRACRSELIQVTNARRIEKALSAIPVIPGLLTLVATPDADAAA
jgi:hypothetical protein